MALHPKTQTLGQVQHITVALQNLAFHDPDAFRAGNLHQHTHQLVGQALAAHLIIHDHSEFTDIAIRQRGIAGHAQDTLLVLGAIPTADRDQGHLAVIIHLGEAHQHGRRELVNGLHITQVTRLRRQAAHKGLHPLGIFRAHGTDLDIEAVHCLPFGDEVRRIRVDGHVPVAVTARHARLDNDARIGRQGPVHIHQQGVDIHLLEVG